MNQVKMGAFVLKRMGELQEREGQTAKKAQSTGTAEIFTITGESLALEIGVTTWRNGDREVACLSRLSSPEPMDRLVHGFRLGIDLEAPHLYRVRLRTPKIGAKDWATLHATDVRELDRITGLKVRDRLLKAGALLVGRGGDVLSTPPRAANDLYVVYDDSSGASIVPALGYALAVAIPMYLQFAAA